MILKNAKVLTDNFQFNTADVRFHDTILAVETGLTPDGEQVLDASGMLLIPGLIDIHTHGALGFDAMDASFDFAQWKQYLLSNGVTTFLPTTVAATQQEIFSALTRLKEADGINLEGPFLSYEKRGAHDEHKIIEIDLELLKKIKNQVKITTVAPEIGENLSKIRAVTEMGIKVSVGHTAADYDTCCKAFAAGATHTTHIFNAMPPLHHRKPGAIGAAVENDTVFCEVIADGFHLHPSIVRLLYRALGADRLVLISDCLSATGVADGEYKSGGLTVYVRDHQARLADGTIAGSTSNLMMMLRRAVSFGIPLADAVKTATITPARAVGFDSDRGSITVGKRADLVLLAPDLSIEKVFYQGREITQYNNK